MESFPSPWSQAAQEELGEGPRQKFHTGSDISLKSDISEFGFIYWLVVLTILKNMKVNGKDYPI